MPVSLAEGELPPIVKNWGELLAAAARREGL